MAKNAKKISHFGDAKSNSKNKKTKKTKKATAFRGPELWFAPSHKNKNRRVFKNQTLWFREKKRAYKEARKEV